MTPRACTTFAGLGSNPQPGCNSGKSRFYCCVAFRTRPFIASVTLTSFHGYRRATASLSCVNDEEPPSSSAPSTCRGQPTCRQLQYPRQGVESSFRYTLTASPAFRLNRAARRNSLTGSGRLSDAGYGGQLRIRPESDRGSLRHCRHAATRAGLSDLSQVTACLLWVFLDVFQPCEYYPWGRPRFQRGEEGKVLRLRLTHLFRRFAGLSAIAPSEDDLAQVLCASRHATRDLSSSTGATLRHYRMPRCLWIT